MELWSCQRRGCPSTPEQIAELRRRKPEGFPHDEDENLRVCTVCRRLPLAGDQPRSGERMPPLCEPVEPEELDPKDYLDEHFISGIKEELAAIEENEKNIQALSQVFRYYAKYARQLSQVLFDFATRQCFPWEIIHALYLADDILLMDKTGRYRAVLSELVQSFVVTAFKKVPSDNERREVAKMLHAWQELGVFKRALLETARAAIRAEKAAYGQILDEANAADDEDDAPASASNGHSAAGSIPIPPAEPAAKRQRKEASSNGAAQPTQPTLAPTSAVQQKAKAVASAKSQAVLERIMATPLHRPFDILGIVEEGVQGHDIRKAYRRIALLIHPDKNPGLEARCQEALVKLQQGREQAENKLQAADSKVDAEVRPDTRSSATAEKNAGETTFKCRHPMCDLAPCKQCANGCCTRNITHCHAIARSKGGLQCFFHPPPRAWARNA